jgi:hypothetical protein
MAVQYDIIDTKEKAEAAIGSWFANRAVVRWELGALDKEDIPETVIFFCLPIQREASQALFTSTTYPVLWQGL